MSELTIWLSWIAQCDLSGRRFDSPRELGGVLLGHISASRIVVTGAHANPSGPHGETWTGFDWHHHITTQQFFRTSRDVDEEPETVIVGTFHTHPASPGPARASRADFAHWREAARAFERRFAGLILTPRDELWEGGYPSGYYDWEEPILSGWLATPEGSITSAVISCQPRWRWLLEQDRLEAKREAEAEAAPQWTPSLLGPFHGSE
jgi:proteasome lid subunit RPN8/RPN11